MDISLLSTTSDPEQLRALAIAMVQKVMAENAELQNRIRILEEQMKLARQQRFGKKCESLAGMQRSLFEEDVDADIAEISAHLDKLLPQTGDEEKTTTRPVRKPLPSPLPRAEKVIPPAEERCPDCDAPLHFIRDEVSEKLEYIPAQVVVNRYIRPQYSCPCCEKVFSGKMPAHILPKSAVAIGHRTGCHQQIYRPSAPVSPAAHFLPNGGGAPRQYNGGYGRCCWRCTGPAGKIVTPRASDTGCYSCR